MVDWRRNGDLRWTCLGVALLGILLNGFAHLPYTLLHSAGRSDITAKFHLAELLPYLLLVWWALLNYGIEGAAAVWSIRCAIDTALLYLAASRLRPVLQATALRIACWAFGCCLALGLVQVALSNSPPGWPSAFDTLWLGGAAMLWAVWHGKTIKN